MRFELQDGPAAAAGGLRVRARNRNAFASTANLLLGWRVLLDGAPLIVGDPAQRDVSGWYPGGSVAIAPQVRWLGNPRPCPEPPCEILCMRLACTLLLLYSPRHGVEGRVMLAIALL